MNLITARFKSQYAFNAEDVPSTEEEILAGIKHKELMISKEICR
jgi:hypothetical protein